MDAAMVNLALAAGGLPVVVGAVAFTTRALVERHANTTAAAIRKQHPQPIPVQTRARQRELTR